jgi:ribosomal protein L7/L12
MEWLFISLGAILVLSVFNADRQSASLRREVARLDYKLNLLLRQMNVAFDSFPEMSERVKELARDSGRKIEAIKVYREETGASLAEAKNAVETFINSTQR